jgi:hypothetical protein
MTTLLLGTFRPTTLAAMAADLSHELASEFDGALSSHEWDALKSELDNIVAVLSTIDDDYMTMLMDAGADSGVILEGQPQ